MVSCFILEKKYVNILENYPSRMTGKSEVVLKKHIFIE
jgi:hypothetical protein